MFTVVVFGVAGDEVALPVAFAENIAARFFARAAMHGINVKKTLVLNNGNKWEGYQYDEDGRVEPLIF